MIQAVFQVLSTHLCRLARVYLCAVVAVPVVFFLWLVLPPYISFERTTVHIPVGTTLTESAYLLQDAGLLRSAFAYRVLAKITDVQGIQAGEYYIERPTTLYTLLARLARGDTQEPVIRVTFPEGTTVKEMGNILEKNVPGFSRVEFEQSARQYEGYLFPDTYFLRPDATIEEYIIFFRETFDAHSDWFAQSTVGKSMEESVIMASILEAEAKTLEDKRIIAGILYRRLSIGMALQVDAVFGYEQGVRGYTPTASDLKKDSPYNTYRNRGLPPTPINNPGYESLLAAVTPTPSPYLYYLTGTDGRMYYSEEFQEHVANKRQYLK